MTISIADQLPDAQVLKMGSEGPEAVQIQDITKGKKVLIFGVPGAFTPTCTNSHLPGYVKNAPQFYSKGVDAIYCVCVNDPFVAQAWGEMIGASSQKIEVLADASGAFTKALGLDFDAPPAGLYGRAKRFALISNQGVVEQIEIEDNPGVCELSSAEAMLALL